MNWTKWSAIAEILSSIAILITLIFLALQMQQNTQTTQAMLRQSAMESDINYLYKTMDNPGLFAFTIDFESAGSEEQNSQYLQLFAQMTIFFRIRENDYMQYRQGFIDEATWNRGLNAMREPMAFSIYRNYWKNYGSYVFNPDFVSEVNQLMENTAVAPEGYNIETIFETQSD